MVDCTRCQPYIITLLCGITDTWNRPNTVSPDWGTSDADIPWNAFALTPGEVNIQADKGRLWTPGTTPTQENVSAVLATSRIPIDIRFDFTLIDWPAATTGMLFRIQAHGQELRFSKLPTGENVSLFYGTPIVEEAAGISLVETIPYHVHWQIEEGVEQRVKVYTGSEPSLWDLTQDTSAATVVSPGFSFQIINGANGQGPVEVHLENLDLSDATGLIATCIDSGNPSLYQPVNDYVVAIGDGFTTAYTTFPYIQSSLQIYVSGILVEFDATDPTTGAFQLVDPAPRGAVIRASFRAR